MGIRSKGCRTCRRRKVKCDQTKPICKRCEVGSFVCQGYEQYSEFVNEASRFCDTSIYSTPTSSKRNQCKGGVALVHPTRSITPTLIDADRVIIYFARNIGSPNDSFKHLGWMATALQHPNTPEPLSSSVCALASVFFSNSEETALLSSWGVRNYLRALQLVQSKVQCKSHIRDEDLPLSILCLCIYEIVAPTHPGAWLNHAVGLAKIMQLNGAEQYSSGYRRQTLHALRYIVTLGYLHQKRRCFLENWSWITIPWGGEPARKPFLDSLHDIFCTLPGILSNLESHKKTQEVNIVNTSSENLCLTVVSKIEALYSWRYQWDATYAKTIRVVQQRVADWSVDNQIILPQNSIPSSLLFSNLQRAGELCLYNAVLLILLRIGHTLGIEISTLRSCHDPLLPREGSPQLIAEEIIRMAPYMRHIQHGNKGIYLLSFPLQIARDRLQGGSEMIEWVDSVLRSIHGKFGKYIVDEL
ncbi:hypothetical protein BGW36DRAFT_388684 [Talaromyces proteolyticus]|uniref:Zn(2)-C6 fungal-type domain-containing protein n=1 Tax=Talaromyces proteolyticus TaxID=1131652 RepID=A0AAD4KM55_9EURO|nr:uncharacterized protein BGW36DRAFT_388684 [Talaromyces proteolyticus]KAH8691632.1 hypothetical protein BGW36DRAFT_388684 [Talaromyces proteolyticus]